MSKRKTVKKTARTTKKRPGTGRKGRQPSVQPLVQEALQVTWLLKGGLKNVQLAYIRVGKLLAQVRDRKLWEALKHLDIESYAEQRLQLKRASLYRYLQVHDWMAQCHKTWLEPHPKGFIPELTDATDLMWIETELARKDLTPEKKAGLEKLQKKGLDGSLKDGELDRWRRQGRGTDTSMKSFLSKLRLLRRRGARLADMPPEAIADLDAAINVIDKAVTPVGKP